MVLSASFLTAVYRSEQQQFSRSFIGCSHVCCGSWLCAARRYHPSGGPLPSPLRAVPSQLIAPADGFQAALPSGLLLHGVLPIALLLRLRQRVLRHRPHLRARSRQEKLHSATGAHGDAVLLACSACGHSPPVHPTAAAVEHFCHPRLAFAGSLTWMACMEVVRQMGCRPLCWAE